MNTLKKKLNKTIYMMIVAISCSYAGVYFENWIFFVISLVLCVPIFIGLYKIFVLREI